MVNRPAVFIQWLLQCVGDMRPEGCGGQFF